MLLLSDELMSCCAAGTNGCLDLRRRAFALDGQVSAEWSRCPGSMARRPRDSVAQVRNQGGGAFWAFAPPKFSKHCIAILTFAETFK